MTVLTNLYNYDDNPRLTVEGGNILSSALFHEEGSNSLFTNSHMERRSISWNKRGELQDGQRTVILFGGLNKSKALQPTGVILEDYSLRSWSSIEGLHKEKALSRLTRDYFLFSSCPSWKQASIGSQRKKPYRFRA